MDSSYVPGRTRREEAQRARSGCGDVALLDRRFVGAAGDRSSDGRATAAPMRVFELVGHGDERGDLQLVVIARPGEPP